MEDLLFLLVERLGEMLALLVILALVMTLILKVRDGFSFQVGNIRVVAEKIKRQTFDVDPVALNNLLDISTAGIEGFAHLDHFITVAQSTLNVLIYDSWQYALLEGEFKPKGGAPSGDLVFLPENVAKVTTITMLDIGKKLTLTVGHGIDISSTLFNGNYTMREIVFGATLPGIRAIVPCSIILDIFKIVASSTNENLASVVKIIMLTLLGADSLKNKRLGCRLEQPGDAALEKGRPLPLAERLLIIAVIQLVNLKDVCHRHKRTSWSDAVLKSMANILMNFSATASKLDGKFACRNVIFMSEELE